jgi:signal transduction histidine kinase/FixJ family two-component response regulator
MTVDATARPLRLLVVDDDDVDRMAVHRALKGAGFDVDVMDAGTVAEAIAKLESEAIDCAIVDYNLPDGEGVKVLAAAGALRHPVPTIMLTGQGDEGLAVNLMKEGARDYIPKSTLSPSRLAQSLRHVVEVSRAEREARRARRSQEFLVDVSAQLAQSLDFVGTAEGLTRALVPELADLALLHLVEDDGGLRTTAAAHVDPEAAIALCQGVLAPEGAPETPLLRALTTGAVLESEVSEDWLGVGARSLMIVPLVARGRTLGALTLALVGARRYDGHDLNVALNLASRGALALDNARVYQELGDEMRLVETLNAFGNRVTAELNLEPMLALAAEEAAVEVGAEFGVFAYRPLVDDQGEVLVHVATAHTPPDVVDVLTAVPREGRITRVADLRAEPYGYLEGPVRSYLAIPVDLADGDFIGTLVFGHSRPGTFQPRHERVLLGIARWTAVAVQNARLLRQAQRAAEARDGMLAIVSHDLRNPLNVIATSASLILEIPLPEEKKRAQLEVIRRTTDRMNRLIQDLLDVTGIEAGKLSINPEALDVDLTIREACEMMAPLLAERRLELVCKAPTISQTVRADRERLLQVFSNLMGNAIRFTPEGGTITVGAERGDGAVVFYVEDTGAGIPSDDLPRLFDRFWKGKNSTGTGLGLPIAKGIVEVHGGTIEVDSEPGRGTRVRFSIPIGGPTSATRPPSHPHQPPRRSGSELSSAQQL